MSLRVYAYEKCDTCRRALRFLKDRGVAHEVIPIRQQPPTVPELQAMLDYVEGDLRRLFNTSGQDYKAMNMKQRLPGMPAAEALELLSENGNLVKRPFAIADGAGLVGFDQAAWEKFISRIP